VAGEAVAVVASEVKDLAQETARATGDISRRVETIQTNTVGAVAEAAQTTAAAVTETQAATEELARMSGNLQRLVAQFTF
jgi:methyl-accepting chemotaxis protein